MRHRSGPGRPTERDRAAASRQTGPATTSAPTRTVGRVTTSLLVVFMAGAVGFGSVTLTLDGHPGRPASAAEPDHLDGIGHTHAEIDASTLTPTEQDALAARVEREGLGIRPDSAEPKPSVFGLKLPTQVSITNPAANAVLGSWEGPYDWPIVGVHASLLPNGKVLAYDSINDQRTEASPVQTFSRALLFDPVTKSTTRVDEALGFNIFCSGLAKLANGLLFTAGGNLDQLLTGINRTTTFDPNTNTWTEGPSMSQARWYPSVTPLANGEMLVTGGGPGLAEVRQADGTFRALTTAVQDLWAKREYPWLIAAPNGRVAYVGPSNQVGYLDPRGSGAYQAVAGRDGKTRSYGSFANFAPGKVLVSGGGYYDNSAVIVDLNTGRTSATGSMAHQRRQHNLTVLADGSVLATGGFENSAEQLIDLDRAVYDAELYNPATGRWRTLAPQQRARQYHSIAMLLPDGRVLSAGGGLCYPCDLRGYLQRNAEIFTPPYLYAPDGSLAPRPQIAGVATEIPFGSRFTVLTPSKIAKVAMIRMSSVTHSVDMEQRYLPLPFQETTGGLAVHAPANANAAPPGWYLLFIIDTNGVPSVAARVHLDGGAPLPAPSRPTVPAATRKPATPVASKPASSKIPTASRKPAKTANTTKSTRAPRTRKPARVPAPTSAPQSPTAPAPTVTDSGSRILYADGFVEAANWSWAPVDPASTNPVHAGTAALAVTPTPWSGVVFALTNPLTITRPTRLEFWINGGTTGGQTIDITLFDGSTVRATVPLTALIGRVSANTWTFVSLDLRLLGVTAGQVTAVQLGHPVPTQAGGYSIDDVRLAPSA